MSETINNLSVDCAVIGYENGQLKALLIKRDKEPEKDKWSLPGSYVFMNESVKEAARRVLSELTGIKDVYLSLVGVYDKPNRYPNKRIVSLLFCALIKSDIFELIAGSHAKEVKWHNIEDIKQLPFDHKSMFDNTLTWLKQEIWRKPILINLLPEKFPLNEMQELYQFILQTPIDNRNFRKKVINQGLVERLNEKTKGGQQRPAYLYQLKVEL